jgi:hypothetical protein
MKSAFLLLSIVAITALLFPKTYVEKCEGNACGDIKVNYDGNCYHAVNTGKKNVKVEFTPAGGITSKVSRELTPGEDWKPVVYGGYCLSAFTDPYRANY